MNKFQILAAIPVFLKEAASYFYEALSDSVKNDYAAFKLAFIERYRNEVVDYCRSSISLWNSRQALGQSSDAFMAMMEKTALRSGILTQQTIYAVINGLRSSIRKAIMM